MEVKGIRCTGKIDFSRVSCVCACAMSLLPEIIFTNEELLQKGVVKLPSHLAQFADLPAAEQVHVFDSTKPPESDSPKSTDVPFPIKFFPFLGPSEFIRETCY